MAGATAHVNHSAAVTSSDHTDAELRIGSPIAAELPGWMMSDGAKGRVRSTVGRHVTATVRCAGSTGQPKRARSTAKNPSTAQAPRHLTRGQPPV